ncbi:leucine-rich repeat-containing G-protein coupled receptor 6-like [Condylostylus longicornis]|uniref:leucine-rich repeat-containing G-protein coupled receptor 6-like n=1 Tax=Condylostylus longicornis TaxID=2530218 RepID=UPI00244DB384|nr:leucine-rich repeat-containing G-protein coupled receptor 6-like [Condylostylus longicornis]
MLNKRTLNLTKNLQILKEFSILFIILLTILINSANGLANCPYGCKCDDETLVVKCGEGHLDVLPIALNPSIQRLVIKNNKIKIIDSSIQFYAELAFLDLSYNHLISIPPKTFAYQKKLQELHLNHNRIGSINDKILIGLQSLTVLNLRANLLDELSAGTFVQLTKLEELNLGQNRISKIDPKAFDGLINLRILYLDDNTLTTVPSLSFVAMPMLAELYLGTNSFTTIQKNAFNDMKGLIKLDLKGAGLHNISNESFKGLDGVRILDLSDNRLQRIPTTELSKMTRLEELSLGQNDFEIIPEGAFIGLTNLKKLEITGAGRLKRVNTGAFTTNANLEWLNLSSNKELNEVQEGALSGLPHLKHVILRDNNLQTLAEGLFPWVDLKTLDLSENPIICDCRVLWLRNLLVVKNFSQDANENIANVLCGYPKHLQEESLRNLSPGLLGCARTDHRKQAMIGALIVGSAASVTALVLILYRCRRKIREFLKGGWGNSALGRKEREYQKTFSDEDYMSRHPHPCGLSGLGIHPTFTNNYNPHPAYPGHRPIPVTEL